MCNKGPYQVVRPRWLIQIFTVPLYPEDTFFLGLAYYVDLLIVLTIFIMPFAMNNADRIIN